MRDPIGCGEKDAIEYMGCSQTMFEEIRAAGIVVPVRRGWYSYEQLDAAMKQLVAKALENCKVISINQHAKNHGKPEEGPTGVVGSEGDQPDYPKTQELLRRFENRS